MNHKEAYEMGFDDGSRYSKVASFTDWCLYLGDPEYYPSYLDGYGDGQKIYETTAE